MNNDQTIADAGMLERRRFSDGELPTIGFAAQLGLKLPLERLESVTFRDDGEIYLSFFSPFVETP